MSAPQKPSVYISYAHDDRKWLDLILEHLKGVAHQEKFDLFFDQVIEPGKEWARGLAEIREKASVAILLDGGTSADHQDVHLDIFHLETSRFRFHHHLHWGDGASFTLIEMAPTGQIRLQMKQPLHLSS